MAAYVLTKAGAKCLMLEAGSWYDTAKQSKMFAWDYDAPYHNASTPSHPFGYYLASVGGWQVEGEPYTNAPGSDWLWWRSRMLGGRTNHWGRISLRMGPYDFKPYSRDGKGFDWPITYDDLAPYYDKTEELIGVFGSPRISRTLRMASFFRRPEPRCYELLIQKACREARHPLCPFAAVHSDPAAERQARVPLLRRSAAGAVPPSPIFPRRRCCCLRRSPPETWRFAVTPWRARCW